MYMKKNLKTSLLWKISFILFTLVGCNNPIERSGIVIDKQTKEPLQNVSIEIYLKTQRRDSLNEKVFTDRNGHFHIREERDEGQLFILQKSGYISHTNSLSTVNDTIKLERDNTLSN